MNTSSYLYKTEKIEVIEKIVKTSLGVRNVKDIVLLSGGLFNTTYRFSYDEGKMAVLRLGPVQRHRLMGFELNLMKAEEHMYALLNESGADFPYTRIMVTDVSKKIVDRDFMIVEYIFGEPLISCSVTKEQKAELYGEIGACTAQIHRVKGSSFGHISNILKGKFFSTWSGFLKNHVEDILKCAKAYNAFSEEEVLRVKRLLEENTVLLDEIKVPHLVHGDLWDANVLLKMNCGRYCVAAIIDADRCLFGDTDFEFAGGWMPIEDLNRGYGMDMEQYLKPDRRRRRRLYQICNLLMESYIGIAEYNNKEQYNENKKSAFELIGQIESGQ